MFEKFTLSSTRALLTAERLAKFHGSSYIGTEHLLLGISLDDSIMGGLLLNEWGFDPETLIAWINYTYKEVGSSERFDIEYKTIIQEKEEIQEIYKTYLIQEELDEALDNYNTSLKALKLLQKEKQINRTKINAIKTQIPFSSPLKKLLKKCVFYANKKNRCITPEFILGMLLIRLDLDYITHSLIKYSEFPVNEFFWDLQLYLENEKQKEQEGFSQILACSTFREIITDDSYFNPNTSYYYQFINEIETYIPEKDLNLQSKYKIKKYSQIKTDRIIYNQQNKYLHNLKILSNQIIKYGILKPKQQNIRKSIFRKKQIEEFINWNKDILNKEIKFLFNIFPKTLIPLKSKIKKSYEKIIISL